MGRGRAAADLAAQDKVLYTHIPGKKRSIKDCLDFPLACNVAARGSGCINVSKSLCDDSSCWVCAATQSLARITAGIFSRGVTNQTVLPVLPAGHVYSSCSASSRPPLASHQLGTWLSPSLEMSRDPAPAWLGSPVPPSIIDVGAGGGRAAGRRR